MPRRVNKSACVGCKACERVCIVGCITQAEDKKNCINEPACVDCGACQYVCPQKCIAQI